MERAGNERLSNQNIVLPVKGNTVIREACMVALDANGYAAEAIKTTGIKAAGCAIYYTDNSMGADGAVNVRVRRGTFVWNNDGSIKLTDCLKDCYIADSKTVTLTADGSSRAGIILEVSGDGVVVEMV